MHKLLQLVTGAILLHLLHAAGAGQSQPKPHIIIIMADDMVQHPHEEHLIS